MFILFKCINLTVKEIGCHQQLQCDLGSNWELGNLSRAVGVSHLVSEIHANLLQNMRPEKRKKNTI